MSTSTDVKFLLFLTISMANVFVVFVISAPHHLLLHQPSHVESKKPPTTIWVYPKADMAVVEANLEEYVESNYQKTTKLHEAIKELEKIEPKSEESEKLLADLNEVKKTIRVGEKPKQMELFEKCQKMFVPLKESRQALKKIRSIFSDFGYIDSDDEKIIKEAVAFYNAHKTAMLEEVEKKGYKKSVEALQKMADAFGKLMIGEITKWAGLAEEEMLREIFGLHGILEQYSVTY